MQCEIEATDEFQDWFGALSEAERESVARKIDVLQVKGPDLGRPAVDTLKGSEIPNLKELRIQHAGKPYRVLFVFDPRRVAILLLGGRKSGNRWYRKAILDAERIYREYLKQLEEEGLIDNA